MCCRSRAAICMLGQNVNCQQLGEPVAYLIGYQEFWSLNFKVTPATLIPRPETEILVEQILKKFDTDCPVTIADLGTGSGAIALAIAHERPKWTIYATDISLPALKIAEQNAKNLHIANVKFHHGDWFNALPRQVFDAMISNPPYIAEDDLELSKDVSNFEPRQALIAGDKGLQDIQHIIQEGKNFLKSGGYLLIEHGYQQARHVAKLLKIAGYSDIILYHDLSGLDRVTQGRLMTG